ncbi:unnamed protein product [Spirodela intermedia]|uniref:Uncharacterized protein n=2 Tax=Spirodela intermedia TaxID=51605 RepID=A0A7I8KE75_SPIIN|nr:unnamed protein product [Spirodela intermedia]CAA6659209.1 unnamed protein product [Spirodela intermedia]CAA6674679.1 unnamed protein product [Spirodela intermedia]CAA7395524.1 unnamed protein product [Spirodela intermedia]
MSVIGFLLFAFLTTASKAKAAPDTLLPSCKATCGDIDIPYPFGIGEGCYAKEYGDFSINCEDNSTAFLSDSVYEIVNISVTGELRIKGSTGFDCYDTRGNNNYSFPQVDVAKLPFTFSHTRNKFVVVGCDTDAYIWDQYGTRYSGGCMSYCESLESFRDIPNGSSCSGLGCCEVSIPRGINNYTTDMSSYYGYNYSMDFNHCGFIFLAEQGQYTFSVSDLSSDRLETQTLPIVLDWSIGGQTCEEAKKNRTVPYACRSDNSHCIKSNNGAGYLCQCSTGYQGNPYLPRGCHDIDECAQSPDACPSNATCANTVGGYECTCPEGYRLNLHFTGECEGTISAVPVINGVGGGLLVLLSASAFTCWGCQRRNLADQMRKVAEFRQKMFEHNGGPLLQQYISSQPGNTFRIFTEEDLAKATSGFADDQIIGRGGHGVVYLGRMEDDTLVAIKKSKMMDERESKEFAREMAILSQINHVNVVKILGCCVEVEVPMLVYEFVPGGTLFSVIHRRNERTTISLGVRLRIATEVAEALAYLHSYASPPILHKDVKTSNILLEENHRAKISDFGASDFAPVDEAEIASVVQGTWGYLDPEYLQTYQFSEKSDVYSFGVVLVELLTGRKPLDLQGPVDKRGLALTFGSLLSEEKLENILDPQVTAEGDAERLREIAELAGRCLSVKGADRPTMKEVSIALQLLGPSRAYYSVPRDTPEEAESLLDHEQSTADLSSKNHTILEIEAGR